MNDIDVTEFIPEMLDRLTPAERAARAARKAEIHRTDFSQSAAFGSAPKALRRAMYRWTSGLWDWARRGAARL